MSPPEERAAQFHFTPETYPEMIRAERPRFEELQDQTVAAIPFEPRLVLGLGVGTADNEADLGATRNG